MIASATKTTTNTSKPNIDVTSRARKMWRARPRGARPLWSPAADAHSLALVAARGDAVQSARMNAQIFTSPGAGEVKSAPMKGSRRRRCRLWQREDDQLVG